MIITDQIFTYWSQNKHLDVDIRLDHARTKDKPPFNAGWIFRTWIDNRRHRADTSFDDRSRGFVWFFSFLVWFYQLKQLYGTRREKQGSTIAGTSASSEVSTAFLVSFLCSEVTVYTSLRSSTCSMARKTELTTPGLATMTPT